MKLEKKEFFRLYLPKFERRFQFDDNGKCVLRSDFGKCSTEYFFGLNGVLHDDNNFDEVIGKWATEANDKCIVITEIESLERFTETIVCEPNRASMLRATAQSKLVHFSVACFGDQGEWAAIFENLEDRTSMRTM